MTQGLRGCYCGEEGLAEWGKWKGEKRRAAMRVRHGTRQALEGAERLFPDSLWNGAVLPRHYLR